MAEIRLATAGALDINPMAGLLQEFRTSVGDSEPIDPARLSRRVQRWPTIQAVYLDDAGVMRAYCELAAKERDQRAEFKAAFPRGAPRSIIGPIFGACARETVRLLRAGPVGGVGPTRIYTPAQVRQWRVWGEFLHGQDESRVSDGGRSICLSWRDYFALFGLVVTVTERSGVWMAEMSLSDLATHGA